MKLPHFISDAIAKSVSELGFGINNSKILAKSVLELSDLYNAQQGDSSVWHKPSLVAAYLSYFFPLNFLRAQAVIQEGLNLGFFDSLSHLVEWGSGPGSLGLAMKQERINFKTECYIDESTFIHGIHQQLRELLGHSASKVKFKTSAAAIENNTLACLSYSLNEISALPSEANHCEAIMIIEPSLQKTTRDLMQLRQKLISQNYRAWAPCLHQEACPLLLNSKTDWCHNRIFIEMPDWFLSLENQLPFKNRSVTYAYLLMKKAQPQHPVHSCRIIGDTLREKGKVRQMVCRGPQREFISWLTRNGEPEVIPRGTIFQLPESLDIRGSEMRLK